MSTLEHILAPYDYALPQELIAQRPASPRDSARLLVCDEERGVETIDIVRHVGRYLPAGSMLVLNDTKVIPARLMLTRQTGGKVEALFTVMQGHTLRALLNRRVTVGDTVRATAHHAFEVIGQEEREWLLRPLFPQSQLMPLLQRHGNAPLPPYIKHSPLTQKQIRSRYQSVFAKHAGSIAAPTASLHFTPRLLASLKKQGITIVTVTLHVHLGTFLPLSEEHLRTGQLHSEWYSIPTKTISALKKAKKEGRTIIAVGTTALRTLESAADTKGHIVRPNGWTNIFIREGYDFRLVQGLFTNFHVPKSSLLMLVSALMGRKKILSLYKRAIEEKMHFFSFGDAMLLVPKPQR